MKEYDFFHQAFHDAAFRAQKIKETCSHRRFTLIALLGSAVVGLGIAIYRGVTEKNWDSGSEWLPLIISVLAYRSCCTRIKALQVLSDEGNGNLNKNCRDCLLIATVLQRPPRLKAPA